MKSLRSKASRFFKDGPSLDEKAAVNELDTEYSAGIQAAVVKKPSRFFGRKYDNLNKPLPAPPLNSSSSTLLASVENKTVRRENHDDFDSLSDYDDENELESSQCSSTGTDQKHTGSGLEAAKLKSCSSFAALRSKSSHLFSGSKKSSPTHSPPPPPPLPQIPVDIFQPIPPRRPTINQTSTFRSLRGARSSLPNPKDRSICISRPQLTTQVSSPPVLEHASTVPFVKRPGPPPVRPTRPASLDEDTLAFMKESSTRMVIPRMNRSSASTSTSTATTSTLRSYNSSIEARLGFPIGFGTPRNFSIEAPLAARFQADPSLRLPVRDSSGSIGYSRFSEYVRYPSRSTGQGFDGIDAEDRDLGPIEQYRDSKDGDWVLERQVSRGNEGRQGGMLFRDQLGGFHFVANI